MIRLKFSGYRNLRPGILEAHEGVNIIYGENAQGKTNLMEAVWLFTGAKSFRGAKDSELVSFSEEAARLSLDFYAAGREQNAELKIAGRRQAVLNDVEYKSPSELAGSFCAVMFSPSHLSLVKDGPAARRKFLDTAIGQLWPKYIDLLRRYQRAVAQRNSALRDLRWHSDLEGLMDVFEQSIAEPGMKIIAYRGRYLEILGQTVPEIYYGLSGKKERLSFSYLCKNGAAPSSSEELAALLKASRKEDMLTGSTSAGPHRDDLEFYIDGISARSYGSQGQQRSVVLALKLSEAEILKKTTGEQPVALLDDVMSELDLTRQDYILNHIRGWQVFITCCDPGPIGKLSGGRIFHMDQGQLELESDLQGG